MSAYVIVLLYLILTSRIFPQPHSGGSGLNEVGRLSTQLEDLEAKCLYCGGKMDSMIGVLQEEVPNIPHLEADMENTLLLTIAGLKQVLMGG